MLTVFEDSQSSECGERAIFGRIPRRKRWFFLTASKSRKQNLRGLFCSIYFLRLFNSETE